MTNGDVLSDRRIDAFRDFLLLLARGRLETLEENALDASDIVQETLLRAHHAIDQFRGQSARELAGWLRQILTHTVSHAYRDARREKRDSARTCSLELLVDGSSSRIERWLEAEHSSPSQRAERCEQLMQLAAALATLPDDQRTAVELHYLHGAPLDEIGSRLGGRSAKAAAGLVQRGLAQLKGVLIPLA